MMSKWRWLLKRFLRHIWVRVLAFGLLGVATALAAIWLAPLVPDDLSTKLGADAVGSLLNIMATSMLAVSTFSLSIMVQAFASAANGGTPRATALLQGDSTSQSVLATFIGAFIYSLVGLIALKMGVYGNEGRLILYAVTIVVLGLIVLALLRWIAHLTGFGLLADTLARVEAAAATAHATRAADPYLGGNPAFEGPPARAEAVCAAEVGYVQHLDLETLSALAEESGGRLFLAALPGSFVHPARALAYVEPLPADPAQRQAFTDRLRACHVIGPARSFDQDPRFGLIVLAEIGARALSPAVNDPGTGIDVIGRLLRVLLLWEKAGAPEVRFPRLWVPPVLVEDMLADGFAPIARDGAAMAEVQVRLQKALLALVQIDPARFGPAAVKQSAAAAAQAEAGLSLPQDRAWVASLAQEVAEAAAGAAEARPAPVIAF
ncbi:DUF2254 domain-containing protein [Phaeovulum sp. W22_SRMD_FR3]|uniref:DUF2254 domain-containing protein n=1 Tax=Phaeovulum sp. W22_SRMD_FR3 TaxID=3240274 RepID=UPI003F9D5B25